MNYLTDQNYCPFCYDNSHAYVCQCQMHGIPAVSYETLHEIIDKYVPVGSEEYIITIDIFTKIYNKYYLALYHEIIDTTYLKVTLFDAFLEYMKYRNKKNWKKWYIKQTNLQTISNLLEFQKSYNTECYLPTDICRYIYKFLEIKS